jgi:hypothetical protein
MRASSQCSAEWRYNGAIYYCVRPFGHDGDHQAMYSWNGADDEPNWFEEACKHKAAIEPPWPRWC